MVCVQAIARMCGSGVEAIDRSRPTQNRRRNGHRRPFRRGLATHRVTPQQPSPPLQAGGRWFESSTAHRGQGPSLRAIRREVAGSLAWRDGGVEALWKQLGSERAHGPAPCWAIGNQERCAPGSYWGPIVQRLPLRPVRPLRPRSRWSATSEQAFGTNPYHASPEVQPAPTSAIRISPRPLGCCIRSAAAMGS
jgi:hypothetical protein